MTDIVSGARILVVVEEAASVLGRLSPPPFYHGFEEVGRPPSIYDGVFATRFTLSSNFPLARTILGGRLLAYDYEMIMPPHLTLIYLLYVLGGTSHRLCWPDLHHCRGATTPIYRRW